MIAELKNLVIQDDIELNKYLTNISPSNMYEILFDSEAFNKVLNTVLEKLTEQTQSNFDVYVKNMWGYVQSRDEPGFINFSRSFKDQIIIPSEYSFIYAVKTPDTTIHLKTEKVNLQNGDLLIFKTEDFLQDESETVDRIALVGSVARITGNAEPVKKALI